MIQLNFTVYLEAGEAKSFFNYLIELAEDADQSLQGIQIIVGQSTVHFSAPPEAITDSFTDLVGMAAMMFDASFSEVEEYREER